MKKTNRVRKLATVLLMLAGNSVKAEDIQLYEPQLSIRHLQVRSTRKELETKYFHAGRYNAFKSEWRKLELLAKIREIRAQLREQAMSCRLVNGQLEWPDEDQAIEAIRVLQDSDRLFNRIFTNKI